jgi:hypothetical protein
MHLRQVHADIVNSPAGAELGGLDRGEGAVRFQVGRCDTHLVFISGNWLERYGELALRARRHAR